MQESDKSALVEFLNGLYEYYNVKEGGNLKQATLVTASIYYNSLKSFTLEQVMEAGAKHLQDSSGGQFFPKVADFMRYLNTHNDMPDIKPEEVLAMAAEPTTPLGVIARIEIGTWTLFNETDPFIRRQSALSFLQKMPDIISRAVSGGYTYHEIGVMEKFGVSLNKPVYHGMAPPTKEALANALATHKENCNDKKYLVAAAKITDSDYVDSIVNESDLALPPPGDIEETKKYIAALLK